ncbi:uncharacterized protein V1510DRAFT_402196 [Dipodascopsis tothii]|uniref:uncharacterized protein n=1 Tax=Dipodascopsis tothii TaxID=44089 RepID=UPI0034CFD23B
MAGGHHGPKTYSGPIHIHPPRAVHKWGAKLLGATMWFWVFYRLKNDAPVLFGFRHPWDGHHGHHEAHGEHKEEH